MCGKNALRDALDTPVQGAGIFPNSDRFGPEMRSLSLQSAQSGTTLTLSLACFLTRQQGAGSAGGEVAAASNNNGAQVRNDGEGVYELVGFISHMGTSTQCGHYVCHLKKDGRCVCVCVCVWVGVWVCVWVWVCVCVRAWMVGVGGCVGGWVCVGVSV